MSLLLLAQTSATCVARVESAESISAWIKYVACVVFE